MDLVSIAVTVGLPALAILYFLEGLLVGKVAQPQLVFVGFVAATAPSRRYALLLVGSCAVAATIGQWILYRGFSPDAPAYADLRRRIPYAESVRGSVYATVPDGVFDVLRYQFDRHGGLAICVTNASPVVRGLLTIPAGLREYPRVPFLIASTIGNVLYLLLYLGVAWGLLEALQVLLGW